MYRAYLFDCDGTIADSMPVHYLAWTAALRPEGAVFTEDTFYAWAGMATPAVVERLNHEQNLAMDVFQVVRRKEECYLNFLPQVQAVPEVLEQIERHQGQAPLAVVSGSPRDTVQRTLEALGLWDRFELVIGAEDYSRGKPEPDCYLLAAKRLGVPASECLVFEDADLGMESARRAGMDAVKVVPPSSLRRA
jgi:HAD superfamily hydrolase (TIGR01509 family)